LTKAERAHINFDRPRTERMAASSRGDPMSERIMDTPRNAQARVDAREKAMRVADAKAAERMKQRRELPDGIDGLPQPLRAIAAGVKDGLEAEGAHIEGAAIVRVAQGIENMLSPERLADAQAAVISDATGQRIAIALEALVDLQQIVVDKTLAPRFFVPVPFGTGQKTAPVPLTASWPEGMTGEEALARGEVTICYADERSRPEAGA
jgi:hypothetical protein